MQIVIDIPEEDYNFIKDLQFYNSERRSGKTIEKNIINGIKNGTVLPEGHGDLIDKDQFEKMRLIDADILIDKLVGLNDYRKVCEIINNSPTIEVNSSVHWIIANNKRQQGEWITYKTSNDDIWQIECNKCHYTKGSEWVMFNALPPYCEKCGAQMKGDAE